MAAIILPRRWQQQPTGPVEIDRHNPLTFGLVHCHLGGEAYHINLVTRAQEGTQTGRMGTEGRPQGLATVGTGSAYMLNTVNAPTALPLSIGVVAGARPNGNGPIFGSFTPGSVGSALASVGTGFTGNAYPEYRIDLDPGVIISDTDARSSLVNTTQPYVCRSLSSTDHALIVGQRITANTTTRNVVVASAQVGLARSVRSNFSGGTLAATAWFSLACMWFRGLDDAEAFEFNAAPWQLFRPRRQVLYFDAGGGSSHNVTAANAVIASSASGAAISQAHPVTAAHASSQPSASGAVVAQSHLVAVAIAVSATASPGAAIQQTQRVEAASASSQPTASGASVSQSVTHYAVIASASVQPVASGAAVSRAHHIAGASAITQHAAAGAAIAQTHLATPASAASQPIASGAAASADGTQHIGIANASSPPVASGAAIIQTHRITLPGVAIDSIASGSAIVQAHLVGASNVVSIVRTSGVNAGDGDLIGLPNLVVAVPAEKRILRVPAEKRIFRAQK